MEYQKMQENQAFSVLHIIFYNNYIGRKTSDFRISFRRKFTKGGGEVFQENLKNKFISIVQAGLSAKSIAECTEIDYKDLSRFKNGHICLCESDAERLDAYLDKVVIPQ